MEHFGGLLELTQIWWARVMVSHRESFAFFMLMTVQAVGVMVLVDHYISLP